MTEAKQPYLIQVDHLKGDHEEEISEIIDPTFLGLEKSDEVKTGEPVKVTGKAYIAGDYLILSLHIVARLQLPCAICNEGFVLPINLDHFVHEEPLEEISKGLFDYGELVRETVLLEIPFYPQCGGKSCLNRDSLEKFLKSSEKREKEAQNEGYQPFQNIDI
jgi:uncharacterized metal-binding protein YceD (DUF177 family)